MKEKSVYEVCDDRLGGNHLLSKCYVDVAKLVAKYVLPSKLNLDLTHKIYNMLREDIVVTNPYERF